MSEQPQGGARPCTESDTFDLINFCNHGFQSGDTYVCFDDAFPDSLPAGETSLRLLSGSSNFEIVHLWGMGDYFELTFRGTNEGDRNFNGLLELEFQMECGGQLIALAPICVYNTIYDWWSATPEPEEPNWEVSVKVDGQNSHGETLRLDRPSSIKLEFDIAYGSLYSGTPIFVLHFSVSQCAGNEFEYGVPSYQLPRPLQEDLPDTGSSNGLVPLAVTLVSLGLMAFVLRRYSSARDARMSI